MDPNGREASANRTVRRSQRALVALASRIEYLRENEQIVRIQYKMEAFNGTFLPLMLDPNLLPGWQTKRIDITAEDVVMAQIKNYSKEMVQ